MTTYKSDTAKYRIVRETRLNGCQWYYVERRMNNFPFWSKTNVAYKDFDMALKSIEIDIENDNIQYRKEFVVKTEIL